MLNLKKKGEESIDEMKQDPRETVRRRVPARLLIFGIIILLVVALAWWLSSGKDVWRAVFLTNNQVYFGHLDKKPFSSYLKLTDVYYLQLNQTEGSAVNIVKLGSEMHGPEDVMTINKEQVLFYEELRPDSAIVKTIEDYERRNK